MKHAIPVLALLALTSAACGGGGSTPSAPAPAPKVTAEAPAAAKPATPAPEAMMAQTAPAATADPAAAGAETAAAAPPAAVVATAEERAEADSLFAMRCTPCHGSTGLGDGAAAAALNPKPRQYSDKAWQAATSDASIAKAIVEGGPAVGLSILMPPSPDLASKPGVVQALVDKIRGFAQ